MTSWTSLQEQKGLQAQQHDLSYFDTEVVTVGWVPGFEDEGTYLENAEAQSYLSRPDWQLPDSFADDVAALPLE